MTSKPTYLGLLNAIAVGEAAAEELLCCWASTIRRDDVRQVITTVALREGEHAKAFAKRMCELGYSVIPKDDAGRERKLAIAASTTLSDREKFEQMGFGQQEPDGDDVFAGMFRDTTIDIQTGALLGRYIAEERDTGRLLRGCYQALRAEERAEERAESSSGAAVPAELTTALDRISARLCAIEERLDRVSNGVVTAS